ncbi:alanine racemase [Kurthia massiliensis]|uniref:alanine racemase n=1 Tax=Kurthia massiliensis TaxID=1033739 RepID=UPI000289C1E0|nr:alanine racemase [Kurthia massiliensis]
MQLPNVFQQLEHPYAWIDLNALDRNVNVMIAGTAPKQIRIATKSIRSLDVLQYIQTRIPTHRFAGYMTFTAAETVYLCEAGLDHFLLGYPTLESHSTKQLMQWIQKGKDITFMVDCEAHITFLAQLAEDVGVAAPLCIDINVSEMYPGLYFGTRRSSLQTAKQLKMFLQIIMSNPFVYVTSLMGYDAQLAGVGDEAPQKMKRTAIQTLQQRTRKYVQKQRTKAINIIEKQLGPLRFVNGGGTGSMAYSTTCEEVTEITIGSGLYKPALFDHYRDMPFEAAAGYTVRATRKPAKHTIVAHGGGYIASGAIGNDKAPHFIDDALSFYKTEGAGEVQTPIQMPKNRYDIGDGIVLRHAKAGELCERFNVLHSYRDKEYVGPMKTYRGDGQCFL